MPAPLPAWTTPYEAMAREDQLHWTTLDDVNVATASDPRGVLASQGQTDTTYDPAGGLEYGRTYYWRIDEVAAESWEFSPGGRHTSCRPAGRDTGDSREYRLCPAGPGR